MSNHTNRSDFSELKSELIITTIVALVLVPLCGFLVDHLTRGRNEIDFVIFQASAESVRALIYEVVGSVIIGVLIIQVARTVSRQTNAYGAHLSSNLAPIKNMMDEFKHSIEELREGVIKATLRSKDIVLKFLKYDPQRGTIVNALDAATEESEFRNVLFDSKTITSIFSEIKQYQSKRRARAKGPISDRDSILFSLGKISGSNFGKKIYNQVWQLKTNVDASAKQDLHQWLIYWCRIDTEAGFGKFDVTANSEDWKKDPQMVLRYSFLTDSVPSKHRLCEFMTGYIEGVISQIPTNLFSNYNLERDRIRIEHRDDGAECSFHSKDPQTGCVFRLTMEQPSSGPAVVGRAVEEG